VSLTVLGIETSCDETAAAVVRDGGLLSSVIASQVAQHRPFGGVVPEIASRQHLELIQPTVEEALSLAGVAKGALDGVAFTNGPGLLGALLVGSTYGKALAFGLRIPFVGVNHILAHVHAAFLAEEPRFPLLALVVSGGHSDLVRFHAPLSVEVIGHSLDDAAGEAFDKVARVLGLPYPGGPRLEELARSMEGEGASLPQIRLGPDHPFDFSFSGLKTAAVRAHEAGASPAAVAKAFQERAISHLVETTLRALSDGDAMLVVAGGVSANTALRRAFEDALPKRRVVFPPAGMSTDNAAMVARIGWEELREGHTSPLDLVPEPLVRPFR